MVIMIYVRVHVLLRQVFVTKVVNRSNQNQECYASADMLCSVCRVLDLKMLLLSIADHTYRYLVDARLRASIRALLLVLILIVNRSSRNSRRLSTIIIVG